MNVRTLFQAALASALLATPALATVVTPDTPTHWTADNIRGSGTVAITGAYPDSGNGSLQFSSTGSGDKADFTNYWGAVAGRTLGNLTSLSYDLFRDSSSTAANYLAPAFRLTYLDQQGEYGYLIFEPVYNGYQTPTGVPKDQFFTVDMTSADFWMREISGSRTIEKYDVTLQQWASGTQQAPSAHVLNAQTSIIGIEVGVGSGWNGTFTGAVDNVNVAFGADTIDSNFEVSTAVPEPAALTLLGLGLGAAGLIRRRTV